MKRELSFPTGCLSELALLTFALAWAIVFHTPPLRDLHWSWKDVLIGTAATIPPFLFFLWTLKSHLKVFSRHAQLMESVLRPRFSNWSILQLAIISVLAGICEETFFRGAVQGSLAERTGMLWAVLLASLFFGAFHLLTWTYFAITAFIGAYLGWLWIWTGNLLTPMVTHAVYDFVALVYFLRMHRPVQDAQEN